MNDVNQLGKNKGKPTTQRRSPAAAKKQPGQEENSSPGRILKQNIRAIIKHRERAVRRQTPEQRLATAITQFSGRMAFVYIHIVWFAGWFLLNTGWFGLRPFDPFPYGLLTMVVSLEAIFLSTFVLISQNRMSVQDQERAELDLQINLLTERELTRVIKMLDDIEDHLGIEREEDLELVEFERDTDPEFVLKEIEREEQNETKKKPAGK